MDRFFAAFLFLLSMLFLPGTEATAKATVSIKRPALVKPIAAPKAPKKAEAGETSAQARVKSIVREESALVVEDADFTAPEGALYTSSDECG